MPTSSSPIHPVTANARSRWHDLEAVDPTQPEQALQPVYLKMDLFHWGLIGGSVSDVSLLSDLLSHWPDARITVLGHGGHNAWQHLDAMYPGLHLVADLDPFELVRSCDVLLLTATDQALNRKLAAAARKGGKLVFVPGMMAWSNFSPHASFMRGDQALVALAENESWVKQLTGLDFRKGHWLDNRWQQTVSLLALAFFFMLLGYFLFTFWSPNTWWTVIREGVLDIPSALWWTALGGFVAQLVDGALGMGYGVTSTSILLSSGVSPAAVSGSIHTAEIFASGVSGYSHYRFGNVNKRLFKLLVIPGVIGAALGALLLEYIGDTYTAYLRPVIAVYTLLLGIRILWNAFSHSKPSAKFKRYTWLAGAGGFLDSFGGGGWGPIVTSTLISKGRTPRFVIGTVSLTEFFVTFASAFTFFALLGLSHWPVIVALVVGSLLAAPLAAKLAGKLPRKASMIGLGILVVIWSIRILFF